MCVAEGVPQTRSVRDTADGRSVGQSLSSDKKNVGVRCKEKGFLGRKMLSLSFRRIEIDDRLDLLAEFQTVRTLGTVHPWGAVLAEMAFVMNRGER